MILAHDQLPELYFLFATSPIASWGGTCSIMTYDYLNRVIRGSEDREANELSGVYPSHRLRERTGRIRRFCFPLFLYRFVIFSLLLFVNIFLSQEFFQELYRFFLSGFVPMDMLSYGSRFSLLKGDIVALGNELPSVDMKVYSLFEYGILEGCISTDLVISRLISVQKPADLRLLSRHNL
jgi:hypothetical protein